MEFYGDDIIDTQRRLDCRRLDDLDMGAEGLAGFGMDRCLRYRRFVGAAEAVVSTALIIRD